MSDVGIDPQREQFNKISAILKSLNPSGALGSSDTNVLLNAVLGVLSGTYQQPSTINYQQLEADNMPGFQEIAGLPPTDIRVMIADAVKKGMPALEIKKLIANRLSENPGLINPNSFALPQLESFADTLHGEFQNYNQKVRSAESSAIENDPFKKAGLPAFSEQYNPMDTNPESFNQLASYFTNQRKNSNISKIPYENPAKQFAQSGGLKNNSKSGKLEKTSASKQDVGTANKNIDSSANELIAAQQAFDKFKQQNPDTYDLEYQSLQDRLNFAQENYNQTGTDMAGFTGATSTKNLASPEQVTATRKTTEVKQKPYFDREKAQVAAGTTARQEDYVKQLVAQIIANKLNQEGKTPLLDALAQRALYAQAAAPSKAASKKNYKVSGTNVVGM